MAEKAYVSPRGLPSTKTRLLRGAFGITAFTVTVGGSLYSELFSKPIQLAALAIIFVWGAVLFLVVRPERFRWYRLPAPVILFILMTAIALFWATEPIVGAQVLALQVVLAAIAVMIAYLLTWAETLRTLAQALRYLLGIGLIIWLWQTFVSQIEASVTLNLISVIAITVFAVQTAAGLVRPSFGAFWVAVALLAIILINSVVTYAALVVVIISLLFLLWARKSKPDSRMPLYWIGILALGATIFVLYWWRESIFPALGIDIDTVMQDNIWVIVWSTQGAVGAALFILLVFVTTWRVWFRAVDQPRRGAGEPLEYAKSALWPTLVTMSLLVFSLVSGALVLEPGWFLLVLFAVKTRFDYIVPSKHEDAKRLAWRDVPIVDETTSRI